MEKFTICVIYTAKKEGLREQFLSELSESGTLSLIRNEQGCLKYDYYLSAEDSCKLVLFEEWSSRECQQKHMTQPHMKTVTEIKNKYIEKAEIKEIKFV